MQAIFFICAYLILYVQGDIYFQNHPSSIKFGPSENPLHVSDLSNIFAASLGYTVEDYIWPALTVTCPFGYPNVATVFIIKSDAADLELSGRAYELSEDISVEDSFEELQEIINLRSYERPASIEYIKPFELQNEDVSVPFDFNKDLSAIQELPEYLEDKAALGSQKITFIEVNSFSEIAKQHGAKSNEVKNAAKALNETLSKISARLSELFPQKALVVSVLLAHNASTRGRVRRQTIISDNMGIPRQFQNIAAVSSNDFPVIFNIVLILAIILIVALIASSVAIAYMDPGRDSIIYRMTNPRMKKDQ